ncbi:hypothetical protein [Methylobacterium gnaphalii]|uniref:Uncharacterized protein n=1 Tax=Methylobacterium gnaphalii TaxID=1010610 RepID=A0A512JS32_9HYPH|nr:hypothetical protein [Methylobacterium gnaphalii]GEP12760.1 hypothetical protein MGN01_46050 [Methylobacterium gnaphalii]GLS49141.1 hypothetical protein GCM10007885_19890 [Methylobacterium gnaphalii]
MFIVNGHLADPAAQLAVIIMGEAPSELAKILRRIDEEFPCDLLKTVEITAHLKIKTVNIGFEEPSGDRERPSQAAQPSFYSSEAHL